MILLSAVFKILREEAARLRADEYKDRSDAINTLVRVGERLSSLQVPDVDSIAAQCRAQLGYDCTRCHITLRAELNAAKSLAAAQAEKIERLEVTLLTRR